MKRIYIKALLFFIHCQLSNAQWQLTTNLNGTSANQLVGYSIELNTEGNMMVVGSPGTSDFTGSVQVYHSENGYWTALGNEITGKNKGDATGWDVAISADGFTIAISSIGFDNYTGKVEVFRFNRITNHWDSVGNEMRGLIDEGRFGFSVSINGPGDHLIVGAPHVSIKRKKNVGAVYSFTYDGANWSTIGSAYYGSIAHDNLGYSTSVTGKGKSALVAAGAPGGNTVLVLSWNSEIDDWSVHAKKGHVFEDTHSFYGAAVHLNANGTMLAIGAPKFSDHSSWGMGKVEVMEWNGTAWQTKGNIIQGETAFDYMGHSLDLSEDGKYLVIGGGLKGSRKKELTTGLVRTYHFLNGNWTQVGKDLHSKKAGNHFGNKVSMSSKGKIIAIGVLYLSTVDILEGGIHTYNLDEKRSYFISNDSISFQRWMDTE